MKTIIKAALAGIISIGATTPMQASENPFIGEVMTTAATFCPRGWTETDGRLIQISENSALFSLLGTTYGGDGRTTFALPDLRGRVAISEGQAEGIPGFRQGLRINGGITGSGNDTMIVPALVMKTCIALFGTYPSRN
jgi:microcystin-dependent protein